MTLLLFQTKHVELAEVYKIKAILIKSIYKRIQIFWPPAKDYAVLIRFSQSSILSSYFSHALNIFIISDTLNKKYQLISMLSFELNYSFININCRSSATFKVLLYYFRFIICVPRKKDCFEDCINAKKLLFDLKIKYC